MILKNSIIYLNRSLSKLSFQSQQLISNQINLVEQLKHVSSIISLSSMDIKDKKVFHLITL